MKIDAVIMAKSTMLGNFCVAGIDINSGKWVRFVSFEDGNPLADFQLMFVNQGGSCQPLDIGRIGIAGKVPKLNHSEDCMIKYTPWLNMGHMEIENVLEIHPAENHEYIFGNVENYIDEIEMQRYGFNYSLILIQVKDLQIIFEKNFKQELKGRADFLYNGRQYKHMRITDPEYQLHNNNSMIADFKITASKAYLVISMPAQSFYGRYYKLVAKIFI